MDIAPIFRFSLALAQSRDTDRVSQLEPLPEFDAGRTAAQDREKRSDFEKPALKNEDAAIVDIRSRRQSLERPVEAGDQNGAQGEQEPNDKQREVAEEQVKELVRQLKARDREVRTHEQTHKAVLGGYASGGISYEYTTGPDGNRYAIGGSVGADLSKEGDPDATIQKMQTVRRAALAPQEPSSADRQVAAQASQIESQARAELRQIEQEERKEARAEEKDGEDTNNLLSPITEQEEETQIGVISFAVRAYEQNTLFGEQAQRGESFFAA